MKKKETDQTKAEDVLKETKPEAKDVINPVSLNEVEVMKDMLADSPEEPTEEKKPDRSSAPNEKKEEKPKEVKEELSKPFAKLGDMEFETQEKLLEFASSQKGYNMWLTGRIKELHPELFNNDGSLKTSELESAVAASRSKVKKVKDAAEIISDSGGKKESEMTDEEKQDVEKAKEILRPLGVIFADDPVIQELRTWKTKEEERQREEAEKFIQTFTESHPLIQQHYEGVSELIEKNNLSLEKAWEVYKVIQGIVENPRQKKDDAAKESIDKIIPAVIKKESGSLPSSGQKDFIDDLIDLPTIK